MTFRPEYQRSVPGGGRTVDTGPPRTNTGLTGLGAVGGATGVGAGALRVIVEFLTQYDEKEVQRLEADLAKLQASEQQYQQFLRNENATRAKEEKVLQNLAALRRRFNSETTKAQRRELSDIRDLQRAGQKEQFETNRKLFAQSTGFTEREIDQLINEDRIREQIAVRRQRYAERHHNAEQLTLGLLEQQEVVSRRLTFLQNLRANVLPKLGSLALGAVGGIFGGALIGLGFTAAQALIDGIGEAFTSIADPAKKAREAIGDVAGEINELAEAGRGLNDITATERYLRQFGSAVRDVNPEIIAQAVAAERLREETDKLIQVYEIASQGARFYQDEVRRLTEELVKQAGIGSAGGTRVPRLTNAILTRDPNGLSPTELEIYNTVLERLAEVTDEAGRSQAELAAQERAVAAAGDLAAAAQDRLASAVQRVSSQRISGIQDQIDALGGPSARTQQLTQELEDFTDAQRAANYESQLAAIQEQRALVLLEQRIRFQGQSVQLSQLSARAQIVAINAQISALSRMGSAERDALGALQSRIRAARRADQDQDRRDRKVLEGYDERIEKIREAGEAQDRFNSLLDLQFKLGQTITRQEGESIADFIQRRANETRNLLAQQAALGREAEIADIQKKRDEVAAIQEAANERREAAIEAMELEAEQLQATLERIEKARQAQIEALNQQRERLQLEVQLQELAEEEKRLQEEETARQHAESLREQLEESQRRDQEELDSRRESLEDQIEAERRRAEEATRWLDSGERAKLRAMLDHATTQQDAQAIVGQVLGAARAYSDLKAYLQGIGIPAAQVNEILNPLKNLVDYANNRLNALKNSPPPIIPAGTPFAKGGAFVLSNAINRPFGMDIRTGEQGQEIGVVLSNKVARILQEQNRPNLPPVNVTVNRSNDPFRDAVRTRRILRETIEDVLG